MQIIESLYVHYPFCSSKCHYCGFYSTIYDESKESLYLKSLKNELTYYINRYDFRYLKTIYVGGGNPGVNPYFIIRLQEILTSLIDLKKIKEYTVECNPLNISSVFLDNCKTSGINRISVGIQSFCDKALIFANRINQNKEVIDNAFTALKEYDFRVSIDLINHLPYSEEAEELRAIEDFLIKYPFVNHLSLYDLSIDEGSFFYRELQKNSSSIFLDDSRNFSIEKESPSSLQNDQKICFLNPGGFLEGDYKNEIIKVSEENKYRYEKKIRKILKNNNFYKYEISNYCRKGFESLHNKTYWQYKNYFGLGPSAHSTVDNTRIENTKDFNGYIEGDFGEKYILSKIEQIEEFMLMGLRLRRGIKIEEFNKRFDILFEDLFKKTINRFILEKMITMKKGFIRTTLKGERFLNKILVDFFSELERARFV